MQNTIERTININAPKERIYNAIADPKQVVNWFPNAVEGDYSVGASPVFNFGNHGKNQVLIIDAKPHEYFAYRWVPGSNNFLGDLSTVATTLVEFHIKEQSQGCSVTVTESGFASLPKEIAEQSFQQNSGGWDFMMNRLEALFTGSLATQGAAKACP